MCVSGSKRLIVKCFKCSEQNCDISPVRRISHFFIDVRRK